MFKRIISSLGDAARRVAARIVPGWLSYAATRVGGVVGQHRSVASRGERLVPAVGDEGDGASEEDALPPNIEVVTADAIPTEYRALFFDLRDAIEYARDIPVAVRILRLKIGGRIVYIVDVQGSDGDDV